MKKMCLFFLVFISITVTTFPQSYLDNYEGIPMVTFGWTSNDNWLPTYNYSKIKEMGTDIYIAPDIIATKFDIYRNANLKLIPYQVSTEFQRVNHIVKYTEGIYSVWEAEGFDNSGAEIQLSYLAQNATIFNEGNITGIKTNGNPGYLNSGPGYIQPVSQLINADPVINYSVKFKLKVEPNGGNIIPLANNTDNVCRIEVTSNGIILASRIIKASEFRYYSMWNDGFDLQYSKLNNASINTNQPVQTNLFYTGTQRTEREIFSNVEYKVYFYGTETDYLTLYVDNVIINDQRGNELMTLPQKQQDIINQANNYNNINQFTTDQTAFDSTVVGWYPIDEPSFIDNFACVKKVAELLKNNATNKKLVTSIAGVWNGRVYDGSVVYRIDELIKRTGIEEVIMNNFIFDYPYNDNVPDYANLNIENMVVNHLDKLNNYNVPFVLALQVGKWHALEGLLEKIPTQEQLLYNMNVGLLYGAEGISISNYFYGLDGISNTTALCGFSGPDNNENFSYSPLWDYIKNEMSPRLKGVFGKTIKNLTQQAQKPNADANTQTGSNVNLDFVDKVVTVNNTALLPCNFDVGTFNNALDTEKKYFMAVNRYYSQWTNVRFTLRNLYTYKNWEVTNFVTNTKTTILTNTSNVAEFTTAIPIGDAGLYSVLPVVKYGGTLINSETITGTNELKSAMTIASGTTLTVSGIYNIYGNITVNSGGAIVLAQGAKLNFLNGSSLIVNGILSSNGITTNKVTFDFITKSYTAQNGIKVNTGASLYVSNSIIKNGWYGIYCNNTYTSSIYNWEITGCNTGIYFYGTNIGISNNYIHDNWMGIALYNSSPTLTLNKLTGNTNYAVSSSGVTSIPKFGNGSTQGKNKITGNSVGVCAFSNSLPMLGNNSPLNGGYNTLGDNTLNNIYAITNGVIFAVNNYWGAPTPIKTYISNGAIASYPYLTYDPTGLSKVAPLAEDAELVLLKKAMDLIEQNDFAIAREICLDIIDNYSDSYAAFNALSLLTQTYDLNEKETTKLKFKTLFNKEKKKLNAVAGLVLAELDKENKLKNIDEVISKYKGDAVIEDALFAKFFYYYNDIQDKENARLVSNELDKLFPNSVSNIVAHQHLGDKDYLQKEYSFAKMDQEQKQNIVVSPIPEEYSLFANYPNPFNPVTVIKYALPFASNVNITVYNTLGQIVKEYFEGTKEAGYYTVNFDGENLSSGVYLYSINAVSANGRQNFNATKKMILMK